MAVFPLELGELLPHAASAVAPATASTASLAPDRADLSSDSFPGDAGLAGQLPGAQSPGSPCRPLRAGAHDKADRGHLAAGHLLSIRTRGGFGRNSQVHECFCSERKVTPRRSSGPNMSQVVINLRTWSHVPGTRARGSQAAPASVFKSAGQADGASATVGLAVARAGCRGKWQAAMCPAVLKGRSSGSWVAQMSEASGQRVRKRQPDGG